MIISVLLDHSLSSSDKLSLIIPQIIAVLIILFLILPLHELAHGWVAYKFGDRTAKNAGRLAFNPLVSIDPWGGAHDFIVWFRLGTSGSGESK